MQDYPEHRLQFFNLLRSITNACFGTLFTMSPGQLKLVIDSIVWAFRHTERNVADTGVHAPCLLCLMSPVPLQQMATNHLLFAASNYVLAGKPQHPPCLCKLCMSLNTLSNLKSMGPQQRWECVGMGACRAEPVVGAAGHV